jgi:tetratricopeptide (TPR) repeat protein
MMYKIFTLLFFVFFYSDTSLQTGIAYYNARAVDAKSLQADPTNINKAIQIFEAEITKGENLEQAGFYYAACLNFKGQFVNTLEADRKITYKKAVEIGNQWIKKYPKNAGIRFELITSIGLLAEINGALKSVENGVLNQMLYHTNKLIQTDSSYRSGAGWKVLAILNYRTPHVPLIMSWPSNEEAKRLLQKTLKYYPTDIPGNYYYAEALLENGEKAPAKIFFQLVTKLPSRKEYFLEDQNQKRMAQKQLDEWK